MKFRQKVIRRIYPDAAFRYTRGGFFWDRTQPACVLVILHDRDSHGVEFDLELSLLSQAIDEVQRQTMDIPEPDPDHPMVQSNRCIDILVMAACSDEDWARDDVQDVYHRMFHPEKTALDRIVEAVEEAES